MKYLDFYSALSTASFLYGVGAINHDDFEVSGMYAYRRIGNKRTVLYQYTSHVDNGTIRIPENCDSIESVTDSVVEFDSELNKTRYNPLKFSKTMYAERMSELNDKPASAKGRLLHNFYIDGNDIRFTGKQLNPVTITYHAQVLDENGLPFLTESESDAIAAFVAYSFYQKKGMTERDGDAMAMAERCKKEWTRRCQEARTPDHLSQNDIDELLNVLSSSARKAHNISYRK